MLLAQCMERNPLHLPVAGWTWDMTTAGGTPSGLDTVKHAIGTIHGTQSMPSAYCRLDIGYEENRRQLDRAGYHESRNWQDVWHGFTSWMAHAWACLGAYFLCGPIKAHLGKEAVGPLPPAACMLLQLACVSHQEACACMCLHAWCQSSRSMTGYPSCPMLYALLQKCHFIRHQVYSRMLCILCARILCACIYVCALHVYTFRCTCILFVCLCVHASYVHASHVHVLDVCIHVCLFHVYASCVCAHCCHYAHHSDCCTSQLQQVQE